MGARYRLMWCDNCRARVQLAVDGTHSYYEEEGVPKLICHFGHCVNCQRPGVVTEFELGPQEGDRAEGPQLLPAVQNLNIKLPPKVEQSYREALTCISAGAWLAAAVMVRRTLEAIAKEYAPNVRGLFKGLDAMRVKGLISEELSRWGDTLRFIGNLGAHPTDEIVTEEDARDAMEFLKAIVEIIYDLRPKFQEMLARRKQKETRVPALQLRPDDIPDEESA